MVNSFDSGSRRQGAGTRDPAKKSGAATADYIDYMADIIQELQRMAEEGGLVTLGGILRLAHTEARLCQEREARSPSR